MIERGEWHPCGDTVWVNTNLGGKPLLDHLNSLHPDWNVKPWVASHAGQGPPCECRSNP